MKKIIFLTVAAFVAAVLLGSLVWVDSGYVLVSWDKHVLETSFWFFVILLFSFAVALYLSARFVLLLFGSDWRFNEWRKRRRLERAQRKGTRGFLNLAQGQWRRAERQLVQAAEEGDNPLMNYLAAARAAYEQDKPDATDQWLKLASQSTRGADLAVAISQIQLLVSRGNLEHALAVVLRLRKEYPKHQYLLKMHVKVLSELEDWIALKELLPTVRKIAKRLPAKKLIELEEKVHVQLLERASHASGMNKEADLKRIFEGAPREIRLTKSVVEKYARLLINIGSEQSAEQALSDALSSTWHDDLVRIYGEVSGRDINTQLLFAEQKLQERPNDFELLIALGRIANRANQPEKAEEYLRMAEKVHGSRTVNAELGKLLAQQGRHEEACEYFVKS